MLRFGWIEIGRDDFSQSLIRVLDSGGMIWEGQDNYASLDAALRAADAAIAVWFEDNGFTDEEDNHEF